MAHRKKRRRLAAVTQDDVLNAAAAVEAYCPVLYKTKQYVPICKGVAGKFVDEIASRGVSPQGVAATANAVESWCATKFKTPQYGRVCIKMSENMVRAITKQEAKREGRGIMTPADLDKMRLRMRSGIEGRRR